MESYNYYATKAGDGTFSASVVFGDETIESITGVKNLRRVKAWAKNVAKTHRILNAAPEVHSETHSAFGSFTV